MDKLNFVDAGTECRAGISSKGRFDGYLNFSQLNAKKLNIKKNQHFKVGLNPNDIPFTKIYLIKSEETSITAKTIMHGKYYALNLLKPLTQYNIDYKNKHLKYKFIQETESIYILTLIE